MSVFNSEPVCLSCGKPPDMEITSTFRALTAHGERTGELIKKAGTAVQWACVKCLMKAGKAAVSGDFAEEEL